MLTDRKRQHDGGGDHQNEKRLQYLRRSGAFDQNRRRDRHEVPYGVRLCHHPHPRRHAIVHVVRLYEPDGSNVDLCRRQAVERGEQMLLVGSPGSELAEPLLPSPHVRLEPRLLLSAHQFTRQASEIFVWLPSRTPSRGSMTMLELNLRTLG